MLIIEMKLLAKQVIFFKKSDLNPSYKQVQYYFDILQCLIMPVLLPSKMTAFHGNKTSCPLSQLTEQYMEVIYEKFKFLKSCLHGY